MAQPPRPAVASALVSLCEDTFFGITAEGAIDAEHLRALAGRRAPALAAGAAGMASWDEWLLSLVAAIAPIAPPQWMPMADAIAEGMSIEGGARGVRALFTSKPSAKEILRVRALGTFAARVIGAVFASTGTFHADARMLRAVVVASLGLPADDQKMLNDELPMSADAIAYEGAIEPRTAKQLIHGAFVTAMGDGLDPREEQAVEVIARKLSLAEEDVLAAREDARRSLEAQRPMGEASVEAVRYVLSDEQQASEKYAIAAARLSLAPKQRHEVINAVNVGGAVKLARRYRLERKEREATLGLAWLAALSTDPSWARRVDLALRHDEVALDLGAMEAGAVARAAVEQHLEAELARLPRG